MQIKSMANAPVFIQGVFSKRMMNERIPAPKATKF